jgi:hypothetical protein
VSTNSIHARDTKKADLKPSPETQLNTSVAQIVTSTPKTRHKRPIEKERIDVRIKRRKPSVSLLDDARRGQEVSRVEYVISCYQDTKMS